MHFIGFSRGTVVNSEIIQRLGTYYPLAGGFTADEDGKRTGNGDLQMTTNTGNNPTNLTPNGRELVNTNPNPYNNAADLNLELTDFRGFKGIEAVLLVLRKLTPFKIARAR